MNLEELKKKHKELGREIEKLENGSDYVMGLRACFSTEWLEIRVGSSIIGGIHSDGRVEILSDKRWVSRYEKWREKGMKVSIDVVEWRGGKYKIGGEVGALQRIDNYVLRRVDIERGCIYNFDACLSISGCQDENIRRFKHNNRPIIF